MKHSQQYNMEKTKQNKVHWEDLHEPGQRESEATINSGLFFFSGL